MWKKASGIKVKTELQHIMLNNRSFNARLSLLTVFLMDLYSSKISEIKKFVRENYSDIIEIVKGKLKKIGID